MNTSIITKILHIAKIIATVILSVVGVVCVFNESDTFVPNVIGLACFAGLIYLYRDGTE